MAIESMHECLARDLVPRLPVRPPVVAPRPPVCPEVKWLHGIGDHGATPRTYRGRRGPRDTSGAGHRVTNVLGAPSHDGEILVPLIEWLNWAGIRTFGCTAAHYHSVRKSTLYPKPLSRLTSCGIHFAFAALADCDTHASRM